MSTRKVLTYCALLYVLIYIFLYFYKSPTKTQQFIETTNETEVDDDKEYISKDEAIEYDWDEIKQFVEGEETIEVCNSDLNKCYSLEVSILGGDINEIHFNNGGYIKLTAELDKNGEAEAYDDDNRYLWWFKIDMESPLINNAVKNWADLNDYFLE